MRSLPLKQAWVTTLEQRLHEKGPLIQVVLGPRQVGKTTGVRLANLNRGHVHYATADEALSLSADWITEQWQNARLQADDPVLIIDEVQKILHWSERIKALWDKDRRDGNSLKLILLGSSSLSLSRGLEESLAGRFELIPAHHWSFEESQKQFGYSLDDYLLLGGYPESARFSGDFRRWQAYLKGSIIETVIGKDILRQNTVRKPALFRQTFELLSAYPAQEISYNKLLGQLQEGGNVELVKHYIELFEGAFLFKALPKYSGSVVRRKSSSPKILPLCPALYSYRLGKDELRDGEIKGRVFEAAVGAELAKLPGELFYWRESGYMEVDFVYKNGSDVWAIEVKSGRKKSACGLAAFKKQFSKAKVLFIAPEHFLKFTRDAQGFLDLASRL